ncbi:SDR family oxidoreductase [Actinoplanes sp. NPDC049316]|uniref:SDR family NAD(P)-dependent oxidoreductase n=1 Tax=Actinoplanes sp. NPDC049316 TaxID=3154727 RepID=UPI00342E7348
MQVVIVTGASGGIGRAAALRLGRAGTTVVLAARRGDELAAVAAQIRAAGGEAVAVPADLRDPAAVEALTATALGVTGRIDVLINNAGLGGPATVRLDDAALTAMVEVNLLAPIRLMRSVLPAMLAAGAGSIVNIGSVAGEVGISGVYSATKFGLRGITDSVRREVAGTGVRVTLIEPGRIGTEMNARDADRLPGPGVVVDAIERALRRPRRRIVVPWRYRLSMLAAAALPGIADRMYAGKAARSR